MIHFLISDFYFFFNDTATTEIYTLSLHDALPICKRHCLALVAERRLRALEFGPQSTRNHPRLHPLVESAGSGQVGIGGCSCLARGTIGGHLLVGWSPDHSVRPLQRGGGRRRGARGCVSTDHHAAAQANDRDRLDLRNDRGSDDIRPCLRDDW